MKKNVKQNVRFGHYRFNFEVYEDNGDKIFSLKNGNFNFFEIAYKAMLKKLR